MTMTTVKDVMTREVLTVTRETPLKDVARILVDAGVAGVPVVEDGVVVGVVSEADLLVKEQGPGAIRRRRLARLIGESEATRRQLAKVAARTAGEAMTAPAIVIGPTRSLAEAAAVMNEHQVNRLPVVEDGRLVGIVARADLVRAYLRTDEDLLRTIQEDVLLRILWLDPATFDVAVRDGEASIRGHVERRSTARIVEETIAMVPGLVSLHAQIGWTLDDRDVRPAVRDAVFPFRVE